MTGMDVTFTCSAAVGGTPRIQWKEFITIPEPDGNLISDGTLILPAHPNHERYSLDTSQPRQFDLTIHGVTLEDAGLYTCSDLSAPITDKKVHGAQLTVIDSKQVCLSTVPASGVGVEGTYYTYECTVPYRGNIAPNMRWSGPGTFGQAQSDNGVRVWNGMSFYADRIMTNQYWTSLTNFTDEFIPDPSNPDRAENVPDYEDRYDTGRIQVNWPPKDMYADPVKPLNEYDVGDQLECFADAFPSASYEWHNLRTNERITDSVLIIPQAWEGFENPMRCDASNFINGFRYNREHHITVKVRLPPTTPTTTPATTTTPPPAVSQCFNLVGRWESTKPTPAFMCLEVNQTTGNIHGVLRNSSNTYWIDLIGSTNVPGYDHASFTGIWALNQAVSTFIGECSRCHGVEHLIVSAISRSKGGPPCGTPGQIFYSQEYEFLRNPTIQCPPITQPS